MVSAMEILLNQIAREIVKEALRARRDFKPYASLHEAYAVLLEETQELWSEIKKQREDRNNPHIRSETVQVGAVAMLMVLDLLS